MLRYVDPNICPPGGTYRYTQPETGQTFAALNLRRLGEFVKAHRIANDIPIGINFAAELEDGACRETLLVYPTYEGVQDREGPIIKTRWGLSDIVSWASTMVEWAKKGFKLVDQDLANDRAEICSRCPRNIDIEGCWGCGGVSDSIAMIRGTKTTPYDEKLRMCGACGCVLKAMVHFPMDTLDKTHSPDLPYWEHCWIPQEKAEEKAGL